jgi:hypothetical protein
MPFLHRVPARLALATVAVLVLSAPAFAQAPDSRVITTWQEPVKLLSGATVVHSYEVVYDYVANEAIQTVRDASGAVIETLALERAPQPNEEEIAEAIKLVYADEELGPIASRDGNAVDGGFLLYSEECEQARCLQLHIGPVDGSRTDRFVVVDLSSSSIVHRDLYPEID